MDQDRERIEADLRGLLDGAVRCDDLFTQMYATDASIYEIRPLGVIRPRGVADIIACVQYAAENQIPLHARGAGTGVAGACLGPGLVIDFSYSMRRVLQVDAETVRLQPGVVCAQLNRHLAEHGRFYGPDPANTEVTTVGGMLARAACGSHWPRYGSARDTIESMQLVLADGSLVSVGTHSVDDMSAKQTLGEKQASLVRRVADVPQQEAPTIDRTSPGTKVNSAGYQLGGILQDGHLNLARMLAGSEGTLALITEATVRTEAIPAYRGVVLLFFDRLESAARGALEVIGMDAAACELMDRRLLRIACDMDVRYDLLIPHAAEALLLVEFEGEDKEKVRDQLQNAVVRLQRRKRLAFGYQLALEKEDVDLFWQLVRRAVPELYRLKGPSCPIPFVEDVAVPPKAMPDFVIQLQNVLKAHELTASLFAHAGQGQLHLRPFVDLSCPADVGKLQAFAEDLYGKVIDVGGTISGQNGDGLSRTWFLRRQYDRAYGVFRQIKRIFDPQNILNPEKIVADTAQPLTTNLRHFHEAAERPAGAAELKAAASRNSERAVDESPIPLQLIWSSTTVEQTTRDCNGCGGCRTTMPVDRMCPIFRYAPREEASPRAKANLLRAVLTGQLDPEHLTGDALKAMADLCVHCHQCRLECPAEVDIPKLMTECKAQYVATNGLRPADWALARIDRLSNWGSRFHMMANWAIQNKQTRWLIERFLGLAQGRKLPRFAPRSFIRTAHRRRLTRPSRRSGRKVLLFVDVYANWYDVQLAEALLAVLEHNGISVYVPANQLQSGMTALSMGAVEIAKRFAAHNVRLLAEGVRQGYDIIVIEPAAALCLKHEYVSLIDEEDAGLVAGKTSEACDYLWRLHQAGNLELDFKPVNATLGYHQPCHIRGLNIGMPGYHLMRLVPGLVVHVLDEGCSGMAGVFGLKHKNYRTSLRAGWGLISALRQPAIQAGATECSACKMQMEQGNAKPTLHPVKVLALSYGLMPEISLLLNKRGEELVVT